MARAERRPSFAESGWNDRRLYSSAAFGWFNHVSSRSGRWHQSLNERSPPTLSREAGFLSVRFRAVRPALWASTCENALQVHEARRMGGGIEITPPCGLVPARRVTVARITAACCAFAIEDEIDGKAIRFRPQDHGSGGSISMAHHAPPS